MAHNKLPLRAQMIHPYLHHSSQHPRHALAVPALHRCGRGVIVRTAATCGSAYHAPLAHRRVFCMHTPIPDRVPHYAPLLAVAVRTAPSSGRSAMQAPRRPRAEQPRHIDLRSYENPTSSTACLCRPGALERRAHQSRGTWLAPCTPVGEDLHVDKLRYLPHKDC